MAHAYETFAEGGRKVFNPKLGAPQKGPTGIAQINCPSCRHKTILDNPTYKRILPAAVAATVQEILTGVVRSGTGTSAALSGVVVAGKTGTTSNYGDAWFVGWTPQMTTAVWVGFPNGLVSMANDFRGGPVEGGTYPAIIWHSFMAQALQILASEAPATKPGSGTGTTSTTGSTLPSPLPSGPASGVSTPSTPAPGPGATTAPAGATGNGTGATGTGNGAGTGNGTAGAGTGGGGGTAGGTGGGGGGGGGGTGGGGGSGGGTGGGGTGGAGLGGGAAPPGG
jgi:penicillin-binding protein 1A